MLDLFDIDVGAEFARHCQRASEVGVRQHAGEFLATVARDHVARPLQRRLQGRRDAAQAVVASLVAVAIIEALEEVHVDQHHAQC